MMIRKNAKIKTVLLLLAILLLSSTVFATQYINTINNANLSIGNNNQLFIDNLNNRTGIGTTTPAAQLHVAGSTPVIVGTSTSGLNQSQAIYVQGRYAYVASFNNLNLVIFDVSNPAVPVKISNMTASFQGPEAVAVQGRYAYLVDDGMGLTIIDISNPANPIVVGNISAYGGQSIYVQGKYAYMKSGGNIRIFDVSNPTLPAYVGGVNAGLGGITYTYWQEPVQGRYAYGVSYNSGNLIIVDVSNPASPVKIGNVSAGLTNPYGVAVQGSYAYVSDETNKALVIFNVSNPAAPTKVGNLTITGSALIGNVFVQGRYAYMADRLNSGSGIYVIDVSNPASPALLWSESGMNDLMDLFVQGRYAYTVSSGHSNLTIFDLGGAYVQQMETGGIETATLAARGNTQLGGDLSVVGDFSVGGSTLMTGGLSIYSPLTNSTFIVDQNSSVAINGTPTFGNKLTVYGNVNVTGNIYGTIGAEFASGVTPGSFPAGSFIFTGTTTGNALIVNSSLYVNGSTGYVGIETANPNSTLDVTGTIRGSNFVTRSGAPVNDVLFPQDSWNYGLNTMQGTTGLSIEDWQQKVGPTNVNSIASDTISIALTRINNGNFVMAYERGDTIGGYFTIFDSSGNVVVPETQFIPDINFDISSPSTISAAPLTNGNFVVTYGSSTADFSIIDPHGNVVASGMVPGSLTQSDYVSAVALTSGNFVYAYRERTGTSFNGVFALYNPLGGLVKKTQFRLNNTLHISAAPLTNGNFVIAYRNTTAGLFSIYDAAGNLAHNETLFDNGTISWTSVQSLTNGNFVLAYTENTTNYGDFFIYDQSGNIVVDKTTFSTSNTLSSKSVVALPDGNFAIMYQIGGSSIYYMIYDKNGNLVKNSQLIDSGAISVRGTVLTNGNMVAAYLDSSSVPTFSIFEGTGVQFTKNLTINGSMGIGTASPITQLHVAGSGPTLVGNITTGLSGPYSVYVQGRYAYVASYNNNSLVIFDVSNPTAPTYVSSVNTSLSSPQTIYVQGKYAYVASTGNNQLVIFDVSNPVAPTEVGNSAAGLNLPVSLYVQGKYAYVSSNNNSNLVIFDVSNPSAPIYVSNISAGLSRPQSVYVQGRYAYVTSGSNLVIFDVSNTVAPIEVGSVSSGLFALTGVYVQGRYAYATSFISESLVIFDVSNPSGPTFVSSIDTGSSSFPVAVYVQGRYAYVTLNSNGLKVFDISNPAIPVFVSGTTAGFNSPRGLFVSGRYAYVASTSNNVLNILDLGGAYIQQLEAGGLQTATLTTRSNAQIGNDLDVRGGVTIGSSAFINGPLSVYPLNSTGTTTPAPFVVTVNGTVGVGTVSPNAALEINGGLRLNTPEAKPNCDAGSRGTLWYQQAGSGSDEFIYLCMKNSTDSYIWAQVARGS